MSEAAGLFTAAMGLLVLAIAMLYFSTRNPGPRKGSNKKRKR